MQLIDTHCHIHSADYPASATEVEARAITAGVTKFMCVGTDEDDSELAVKFVQTRPHARASIGLHPHDATHGLKGIAKLKALLAADDAHKIAAIGECGLDYFYDHSPRQQQIEMLHAQLQLATEHNLPVIFHVREAFDDFWPIFEQYQGLRGVLHSFTDSQANLEKALSHNLYIGANGIATFTKVDAQKDMYKAIPLESMVLETDAPFLTPVPHRGSMNEPAYVRLVAQFFAELRHQSLDDIGAATSHNATKLFSL